MQTRIALGALLAISAISTAACSGNTAATSTASPAPSASPTSSAAPEIKTVADIVAQMTPQQSTLKTTHETMSIKVDGTDFETADGDINYAAPTQMHLTMNINVAEAMVLAGQKDPGITASMTEEIISNGTTLYVKLPAAMAKNAGITKPWLSNTTALKQLGITSDSLDSDPAKSLDKIKEFADIASATPDTLNGESVTHYVLKINQANYKAYIAKNLKNATITAAVKGLSDMNAEIWLNDKNLPVKQTSTATVKGKAYSTTITMTDWGKPVTITIPPADQVQTKVK
jgi:hypothetical protein